MIRSDDYKRRMEDPTRCIQVIPEQKKAQEEIDRLRTELDKAKQADVSDRTKRRKLLNVLDEVGELYELQMGRVKA